MSICIQKYHLSDALPKIFNHNNLPHDTEEIGRCIDTTETENLYILVKHGKYLSILIAYTLPLKSGKTYFCDQFDFPLKVLSWFPKALENFRRPVEGGIHAGAMTSADEDVDGEMLCVQNATDGYCLVNRSRQGPFGSGKSYMPTDLFLSFNFLYHLGFLDLLISLGEKYERGEL
jgi:hypothetical protein